MKRFLREMLPTEPIENYRPPELHGMELDLYWPELNIAAEFQGDQHYVPVYGTECFYAQRGRDKRKKQICRECGVALIEVDAIHLQYGILNRKVKFALRAVYGKNWKGVRNPARTTGQLRSLNKEAIEYRKTLKSSFGSPTAYRKGRTRRVARQKWYAAKLATPPAGITTAN
jgi:hypothetical protein